MTKLKQQDTTVEIKAPSICIAQFSIEGVTPYVQLKFTTKAKNAIMEKMTGKKAKRDMSRHVETRQDIVGGASYFKTHN